MVGFGYLLLITYFINNKSLYQFCAISLRTDGMIIVIGVKRGDHNRLGFALQLTTARFLGTFLEDPIEVPGTVLQTLVRQLRITNLDQLSRYRSADQRWEHTAKIRSRYGFGDWIDPAVGFRLSRWLYALCWTGTDQPGVLFDRATAWLLAHKILLPGCTTLERFMARLRNRVEERLWRRLGCGITDEQRTCLEDLLTVRRAAAITQPQRRRCLTGFYVPLLPKPQLLELGNKTCMFKILRSLTTIPVGEVSGFAGRLGKQLSGNYSMNRMCQP
jgi:hypothetical protein